MRRCPESLELTPGGISEDARDLLVTHPWRSPAGWWGARASGVTLSAIERDLVAKALARAGNNKSRAAQLLGVPRGQLYSLLRRHGLTDARR